MGALAICSAVILGVIVIIIIKVYLRISRGVCNSTVDLTGKTVVITGPTAGIGVYTALDMAARNARVVLACRNVSKGAVLKKRIANETHNGNVVVYELDVSCMKSVRDFVTHFKQNEARCDILINNAAVTGFMSKQTTNEGLELISATNVFGPFLLTNLLLDTLKASAPSRIVNVSSMAHIWGNLVLDNLNSEKNYSMGNSYTNSKLALNMLTRQFSKLLEGSGVTANSLHPGAINSNLFLNLPVYFRVFVHSVAHLFFKTPQEGAQTTIYCAVSPEVKGVSGCYFSDCELKRESSKAYNDKLAEQLWHKCEQITGLNKTL